MIEGSKTEKECHVENSIASARLYIHHEDEYPGPAGRSFSCKYMDREAVSSTKFI